MANRATETRSLRVALIGIEHYAYIVTDRRTGAGARDRTRMERRWYEEEFHRHELELAGPASLTSGQGGEVEFELPLPGDAPPASRARF